MKSPHKVRDPNMSPGRLYFEPGGRYYMHLMLTPGEALATNEQLTSLLAEDGFADVVVAGKEDSRAASGTWAREESASAVLSLRVRYAKRVG